MNDQRLHARPLFPSLCAGCLVLLLAACTSPPDSGNEDSGSESATAQTADRECRTTGSAGTKLKRSVCMSAEEWAIADAKSQEQEDLRNEYFRRVRESATLGPGPEFDSASGGF